MTRYDQRVVLSSLPAGAPISADLRTVGNRETLTSGAVAGDGGRVPQSVRRRRFAKQVVVAQCERNKFCCRFSSFAAPLCFTQNFNCEVR